MRPRLNVIIEANTKAKKVEISGVLWPDKDGASFCSANVTVWVAPVDAWTQVVVLQSVRREMTGSGA